jgi:protein-S-isoprenylcysteine O-methyltransferase Ste14
MVNDTSPSPPPDDKPFALRAVLFTAGFLLFILGVVPSLFYLLGEIGQWNGFRTEVAIFWNSLRALVGTAIFATGLIAYLACSAWLIFYGRGPHVEFDPPKVFVASGPYRWVRNPVVITLMTTVLGLAVVLNSWGILLLVVLGMPLAHYQVTKIEEPRLRNRFGQSYVDYCERVPRWVPCPPRD